MEESGGKKTMTRVVESEGNPIYLVGKETEKEMGGSEYYSIMKIEGGVVPRTDIKILKNCMKGILSTIDKKYIASCHDVSEGGIGVCISEMSIGGDIGCSIDLSEIGNDLRSDFKLFSESNIRWIIEVKKEKEKDFEKLLKNNKTTFIKFGNTKSNKIIIKDKNNTIVNQKVSNLRDIWKNAIWNIMG